jgi:hypothetical protein
MRALFLSEGPIRGWTVIEMTTANLARRMSRVGNLQPEMRETPFLMTCATRLLPVGLGCYEEWILRFQQ